MFEMEIWTFIMEMVHFNFLLYKMHPEKYDYQLEILKYRTTLNVENLCFKKKQPPIFKASQQHQKVALLLLFRRLTNKTIGSWGLEQLDKIFNFKVIRKIISKAKIY